MSKSFELDGIIKEMMDVQTFPSGFCKREFVVTEEDRYPQDIKMSLIKEKCSLLDTIKVGDEVRVTFSLRGNLYKERYYTDLQAFKIEKLNQDGSSSEPEAVPPLEPPVDDITDDDMPF